MNTSSSENKPLPVTSQEEKEIHRVFELLSDYQEKSKLKAEIHDVENWIGEQKKKSFLDSVGEAAVANAYVRIEELNKQYQTLEMKPDKKISVNDVTEMLRWLKQKASKKEVEEIIWEVDENLDGCLDWSEFRLMFNRNILDRTGLEPSRMVSHVLSHSCYYVRQSLL
ncbi:hypothetical protein EON64_05420 [archaeon]|nr:MAG: hypothetical protein EON64_05420 [archaeon]